MHASSPIRIGYCLSLTGALAGNGQSAQLAHEIWRDDVNRSGGLLGRPVELICYDDGTEASRVEGLYRRLLDDEQVDLVVGGYGTNTLRPAMPLVIDRRRFFVGLMGLGVNPRSEFNRRPVLGRAPRTEAESSLTTRLRRRDRVAPSDCRSPLAISASRRRPISERRLIS